MPKVTDFLNRFSFIFFPKGGIFGPTYELFMASLPDHKFPYIRNFQQMLGVGCSFYFCKPWLLLLQEGFQFPGYGQGSRG